MKTAMILAAGRGERLKPITNKTAKAMCAVQGKPLIEHHVVNLAKAGFERIVINHAYLGGQIRQHLGDGKAFGVEILYSPEPPGGLETAGGIVKALPLLGNKPFLTVNADIFTDFDFASLEFESLDYLHLVLVTKNPSLKHQGDFGLLNNGLLTNSNREFTFPGIACYNPRVFISYQQGRYSVVPLMRALVDEGKVSGSLYQGVWFDIGSAERLNAANNFVEGV
jgi:MurNAc alpha-1-phosphate uridylyltransferase